MIAPLASSSPVLAVVLIAAASLTAPAGGATPAASPAAPAFGFDAPLLEVDRFSDRAATFLRRSVVPGLPGPDKPIHLDAPPFLLDVTAPGGRAGRCYDLDRRPATAARLYVFYDRIGNYILTQFPVVDVAPGDPGYTDLWDIWKVTVPDTFKPDNWIRDMGSVERLLKDASSGFSAERTGALLNGPIVPEGSTARLKAERRSGEATLRYFWYRGKRAPYLYFEEKLRLKDGVVPVSRMAIERGAPSAGASSLTGTGPISVDAMPGDAGYSPLHALKFPVDEPKAADPLNCPIVGP